VRRCHARGAAEHASTRGALERDLLDTLACAEHTNPNDLCDADCQPRCEAADWPGFDHATLRDPMCYLLTAAPLDAAGVEEACRALHPSAELAPVALGGDRCAPLWSRAPSRLLHEAGVESAWSAPRAGECAAVHLDTEREVSVACDSERRFVCRIPIPGRW